MKNRNYIQRTHRAQSSDPEGLCVAEGACPSKAKEDKHTQTIMNKRQTWIKLNQGTQILAGLRSPCSRCGTPPRPSSRAVQKTRPSDAQRLTKPTPIQVPVIVEDLKILNCIAQEDNQPKSKKIQKDQKANSSIKLSRARNAKIHPGESAQKRFFCHTEKQGGTSTGSKVEHL